MENDGGRRIEVTAIGTPAKVVPEPDPVVEETAPEPQIPFGPDPDRVRDMPFSQVEREYLRLERESTIDRDSRKRFKEIRRLCKGMISDDKRFGRNQKRLKRICTVVEVICAALVVLYLMKDDMLYLNQTLEIMSAETLAGYMEAFAYLVYGAITEPPAMVVGLLIASTVVKYANKLALSLRKDRFYHRLMVLYCGSDLSAKQVACVRRGFREGYRVDDLMYVVPWRENDD